MSRLSISREVKKGRIVVVPSTMLGPTLIRRTGRGSWVNHFTNAPVVYHDKFAGGSIAQAGRFRKVRTINHIEHLGSVCISENLSTGKARKVTDKSNW